MMRFRAAHLACVLLLLSTMGASEARAQRTALGSRGTYIGILLQQGAVVTEDAFPPQAAEAEKAVLPGSSVAHIRGAWTMRPPSAHTVRQHAVTGSGL